MRRSVFSICLLPLFWIQSFAADLCLIERTKVIRIGNRLFLTVGDFVYTGSHVVSPDVKLQWLDLDGSFPVDGLMSDIILHNTTNITTPSFTGDAFWTDANETTVYTVGKSGNQSHNGQSTLDAYNVQGDVWLDVSVSRGPFDKGSSLLTMYASSSAGGGPLSFISGGFEDFQGGMVVFNASDPHNPSWKNSTGDDLPYFRGPYTQYVRYGSAGILVVIGGRIVTGDNAAFRQMNSIQVYDIAAGKWFTQTATGETPPTSPGYCSAVSAAPDDSSMHFILYGGWTNEQGDFDNEHAAQAGVYILIMPAFHWIRINTTHVNGLSSTTDLRVGHKCATYKDRQFLVFGGSYDVSTANNKNCNSTFSPLRMLDLTSFQWQRQWPLEDTTYQVPQAVIDVVGGGPSGGAKPATTWQNALGNNAALFSRIIPRYDPKHPPQDIKNNSGTINSPGNGAATSSSTQGSGVSKGAIAGAVVGAVAGLAFIIAVMYFLFLRLRQSQSTRKNEGQHRHTSELETESEKPSLMWRLGLNKRQEKDGLEVNKQHEMDGVGLNKRHEMEGHDPAKLQPKELDGQSARVEVPDVRSTRHDPPLELDG